MGRGCRVCGAPRVVKAKILGQFCSVHTSRDLFRLKRSTSLAAVTAAKIAARGPCPTCSRPMPADRPVWAKHCSEECTRRAFVESCPVVACHWCGGEFRRQPNMKAGMFCSLPHRDMFRRARTRAESWVAERDAATFRAIMEASCPGAPVVMPTEVCQHCGENGNHATCRKCDSIRGWIAKVGPTRPCVICAGPIPRAPVGLGGKRATTCSDACAAKHSENKREARMDARKRAKWSRRASGLPRNFPTKAQMRKTHEASGWKCYLCGIDVVKATTVWAPNQATIDHFIPVSAKTVHPCDPANWRTACAMCNSRKRDKILALA